MNPPLMSELHVVSQAVHSENSEDTTVNTGTSNLKEHFSMHTSIVSNKNYLVFLAVDVSALKVCLLKQEQ